MFCKVQASALALGVALYSTPAWAQETGDAPPPVATEAEAVSGEGKQVYTPADFVRFAPKTAYDMLVQVPSFTIRQAERERGLGQASENVLINGQRVANKSGGAVDELQRVSAANVARIEVVDASTLGIAGLSGQVANIILLEQKTSSGQFEWEPNVRAHYAEPNLTNGLISYSSSTGPLDYTLSLRNDNGRGGFGGGSILIRDPLGNLSEQRHQIFHSEAELPTLQAKFGIDGPGASVGNLTLAYTPYWNPVFTSEVRSPIDDVERIMVRGKFGRAAPAPAKFKPGDRVRAKNIHPVTHTRLPRYVRGHVGVVERDHGCQVFPDSAAMEAGENPQWLYTVVFDGAELWGPDADPTVKVSIDAFEPYLEAA